MPPHKDGLVFGCIRWGTLQIIIVMMLLCVLLIFAVAVASAAGNTTSNATGNITGNVTTPPTIPPTTKTPTPTPTIPIHVRRLASQGDCVMLGEYIDTAGIGWYTGYIAYYGRYRTEQTEGLDAGIVKTYRIEPWEQKDYFIDPAKFKDYPGNWYVHYEQNGDEVGNSKLFYVSIANCTKPNATPTVTPAENKTVLVTGGVELPPKFEKGVDYIISRNTDTTISVPDKSHYWIFTDAQKKMYDIPVTGSASLTFTKDVVGSIPLGTHPIVFVSGGMNGIIEETYDAGTKEITSPFRSVVPVSIGVSTADNAKKELLNRVSSSIDDTADSMVVLVQNPTVELKQLEQQAISKNKTAITLSGYTNAPAGATVTIELDRGSIDSKLARQNTWVTTVNPVDGKGTYRTWNVTFMLNFNDYAQGQHTLSMTTQPGATAAAPLFVRKELAEHYTPPTYIQYADNNPFVPIPTPITLPREVVTVIQTVVTEKVIIQERIVQVDPYPYMIAVSIGVIFALYALYIISRAVVKVIRMRTTEKVEEPVKENI